MRIALVAGEASGDLLGVGLMREILKRDPEAVFEGIAGPLMKAAGCDAWEDAAALSVMGLVEPLREIPRLFRLRRRIGSQWIKSPPDVFVGIDAPDFNLGLEKRLRNNGIRTVHYVSPSVWAWRQGRVRKIAQAADKVLCLLPFEKAFYDRHQVRADFVGHPLADNIPASLDRSQERRRHGLGTAMVVAVMPGSRVGEVARLGPVFAAAAKRLGERFPDIGFIAPLASEETRRLFAAHLVEQGVAKRFTVIDGEAHSAIAAADVVLLASGTAALEAALLCRPIVAAYRVAALTYYIVRTFNLLKVKYVTLPNLLTQEPLVPEFLQDRATPQALSDAVGGLLDDPGRRAEIAASFAALRNVLRRGADARAAEAVMNIATEAR